VSDATAKNIMGLAKNYKTHTVSDGTMMDGATSHTVSDTETYYEANGKLKSGIAAETDSVTDSNDGWDNLTHTVAHAISKNYMGLIKSVSNHSVSDGTMMDGGTSHSVSDSETFYESNGKLKAGMGVAKSHTVTDSDDGWGNLTHSESDSTSENIMGQVKVHDNDSQSHTTNKDGSYSDSHTVMTYAYDGNGRLTGVAANGVGNSFSDDGFGNTTVGNSIQEYALFYGQVKMIRNTSHSHTTNYDDSWSESDTIVDYDYEPTGRMVAGISAHGNGTSISDDGWGNLTTGTITQKFKNYHGQAKLFENETDSETHNHDL
jgi:YD repeat-containing protein